MRDTPAPGSPRMSAPGTGSPATTAHSRFSGRTRPPNYGHSLATRVYPMHAFAGIFSSGTRFSSRSPRRPMTERWDVVVVGAGPAGASAAYLLARSGHRVLVVDRQHFPRPKACAEYLSPGVRDVLRRLDLAETVLDGAQPVQGMEIVSPAGKRLRVSYTS